MNELYLLQLKDFEASKCVQHLNLILCLGASVTNLRNFHRGRVRYVNHNQQRPSRHIK